MLHKAYHFHHFQVFSSVSLSPFKSLCNHYHYPYPEFFSSCKTATLCPLKSNSPEPSPLPGNSWAASCDYMLHTCPRFVYKWNQAGGARFTLAFYHSASWFWDSSNLLHLSITTFPGISPAHDGPSRLYAIGSICYCNFVWILVSTCMRKTVYPFLPSPLLGFLLFFL